MTDVSIEELQQLFRDNSDSDGQWRGADVCDALARLICEKGEPEVKPERQLSLERAIALTCGDRNRDYGDPRPNMQATADMWSAYKGVKFEAHDVPAMMMLLKIVRISVSPWKADNWDDAEAYGGMGAELRPPAPEK